MLYHKARGQNHLRPGSQMSRMGERRRGWEELNLRGTEGLSREEAKAERWHSERKVLWERKPKGWKTASKKG